ncbi:MAG: hypothetical protein DMG49_20430 [Acidobacteria bacterium]|nr:MAG: hypothetical protein DMG49_20430 [Acidobacteriota bacterium]
MNIAEVVSGRAKLKGIRRALLSVAARNLLADQLRALLPAEAVVGPLRIREAQFKPGRKLTAYYDAAVYAEGKKAACVRPIAVTWESETGADRSGEMVDITKAVAEAVRRGVAAPFRQLTADLPELNMHMRISPLDARFTQLARLSDPQHVRTMLADTYASANGAGDRRRIRDYKVTSVKYRPGRRHVLRYDPEDPGSGETVFAKVYIGDKEARTPNRASNRFRRKDGARTFRVAGEVAGWLAERGGLNCLRPLAYVAEDAVVLYPRLCGVPLSDYARRLNADTAKWLRRAGEAVCALHQLPVALASRPEHGLAAEIRSIVRNSSHIRALLPDVGSVMEALLDRAQELHDRLSQEPPTFTHGDLKTEHLWVCAGGLTVMDLDSSRLADPALDVGYFLADWQFRQPHLDQAGTDEMYESFLAGYVPRALKDFLMRVRLCEAVELVKCAVRRVPLFENDWALRTAELVERSQALIHDVQRTLVLRGRFPLARSFDPRSAGKSRYLH